MCFTRRMAPTGITKIRSTIRIMSMNKLTIRDLDVRGQRVLVRVDFNVPTEERDGKIAITDDTQKGIPNLDRINGILQD